MFNIKWNSQRNNHNFLGKLSASIQCFPTSSVMFISYWKKEYETLEAETKFTDDVEANVGKRGTAEEVKGWSGRSSAWWIVHLAAIKKVLPNQKVVYSSNVSLDRLIEILQYSPVIFSASKIGGLPGGHIFVVVGYDKATDSFIINDPFGNAMKNYKDTNGANVKYPRSYLSKFAAKNAIYATEKFPSLVNQIIAKKKA